MINKRQLGETFSRRSQFSLTSDCSLLCQRLSQGQVWNGTQWIETGIIPSDPDLANFDVCKRNCVNQFRLSNVFDTGVSEAQSQQDILEDTGFGPSAVPMTTGAKTGLLALAGFGTLIGILIFRKRKTKKQ